MCASMLCFSNMKKELRQKTNSKVLLGTKFFTLKSFTFSPTLDADRHVWKENKVFFTINLCFLCGNLYGTERKKLLRRRIIQPKVASYLFIHLQCLLATNGSKGTLKKHDIKTLIEAPLRVPFGNTQGAKALKPSRLRVVSEFPNCCAIKFMFELIALLLKVIFLKYKSRGTTFELENFSFQFTYLYMLLLYCTYSLEDNTYSVTK